MSFQAFLAHLMYQPLDKKEKQKKNRSKTWQQFFYPMDTLATFREISIHLFKNNKIQSIE